MHAIRPIVFRRERGHGRSRKLTAEFNESSGTARPVNMSTGTYSEAGVSQAWPATTAALNAQTISKLWPVYCSEVLT